jgi:hypothetical protein
VVEDRYSSLLKASHAPAGCLPDLLARVQVRYPETPIVFAETRPLAEEWTFRWLGAALAEAIATGEAWGGAADFARGQASLPDGSTDGESGEARGDRPTVDRPRKRRGPHAVHALGD